MGMLLKFTVEFDDDELVALAGRIGFGGDAGEAEGGDAGEAEGGDAGEAEAATKGKKGKGTKAEAKAPTLEDARAALVSMIEALGDSGKATAEALLKGYKVKKVSEMDASLYGEFIAKCAAKAAAA